MKHKQRPMVSLYHPILYYPIGTFESCIRSHKSLRLSRRWMIVHGLRQRNQRHLPRMALIRPSFTASALQVDAPGMAPLVIPYSPLPEDIIEIE